MQKSHLITYMIVMLLFSMFFHMMIHSSFILQFMHYYLTYRIPYCYAFSDIVFKLKDTILCVLRVIEVEVS
jgi:hypothetical protein